MKRRVVRSSEAVKLGRRRSLEARAQKTIRSAKVRLGSKNQKLNWRLRIEGS